MAKQIEDNVNNKIIFEFAKISAKFCVLCVILGLSDKMIHGKFETWYFNYELRKLQGI